MEYDTSKVEDCIFQPQESRTNKIIKVQQLCRNDINLSHFQLFLETMLKTETSGRINFHPDVNHHLFNSNCNEIKSLTNKIFSGSFVNSSMIVILPCFIQDEYSVILSTEQESFPMTTVSGSKQKLEKELLPVTTNMEPIVKDFFEFLQQVNILPFNTVESVTAFIDQYNAFVLEKNNNLFREFVIDVNELSFDGNSIYQTVSKIVTEFQKICSLRFGMIDGLHRMNIIADKKCINNNYLSTHENNYPLGKNEILVWKWDEKLDTKENLEITRKFSGQCANFNKAMTGKTNWDITTQFLLSVLDEENNDFHSYTMSEFIVKNSIGHRTWYHDKKHHDKDFPTLQPWNKYVTTRHTRNDDLGIKRFCREIKKELKNVDP